MPMKLVITEYQAQYGKRPYDVISVVKRDKNKWAISDGSHVFNLNLEWEYEPLPSNRTYEFIKRTRFSLKKAMQLAELAFKDKKAWYKKREKLMKTA
jgi:hypothetical protein